MGYKPTPKTWKDVSVAKGATIRVEFNTATNSNQTSGRIPYARGRWIALTLVRPSAKKAQLIYFMDSRLGDKDGALYNLKADPHEKVYLYDRPEHARMIRSLETLAEKWNRGGI